MSWRPAPARICQRSTRSWRASRGASLLSLRVRRRSPRPLRGLAMTPSLRRGACPELRRGAPRNDEEGDVIAMAMTMTEKILAAHVGRPEVRPGELIDCTVDFLFANDITAPLAIKEFEKMGVAQVFDADRIAFVFDHYVPNKDIASAQQCKITRDFVDGHNLPHFYDVGRSGIAHVLLAELGYVVPGDVFVGADSHTCNHGALRAFSTGVGSSDLAAAMALGRLWLRVPESMKFVFHGRPRPWVTGKDLILKVIGELRADGARDCAMQFCGDTLAHLTMDERFSITNMAVEAGAKNGIMEADDVVLEWIRPRARRPVTVYRSDPGASY